MRLEKTEKNLLKILFKKPSLAHLQIPNGDTFLHIAAAEGWLEGVKKLLALGADSFSPNENNETPYDLAIAAGHHAITQELLSHPNNSFSELGQASSTLIDGGRYLPAFPDDLLDPLSTNQIVRPYEDTYFLSHAIAHHPHEGENDNRETDKTNHPLIIDEPADKRKDNSKSPQSTSSEQYGWTNPQSPSAEIETQAQHTPELLEMRPLMQEKKNRGWSRKEIALEEQEPATKRKRKPISDDCETPKKKKRNIVAPEQKKRPRKYKQAEPSTEKERLKKEQKQKRDHERYEARKKDPDFARRYIKKQPEAPTGKSFLFTPFKDKEKTGGRQKLKKH